MDYIKEAMKTNNPDIAGIKTRLHSDKVVELLHSFMGMSTEANELLDNLKAHLIYGKGLDIDNIHEELGDCMWFIALACDTLDISLEEIMEMNIRKLKKRYPKEFSSYDALNRDTKKELEAIKDIQKLNDLKKKVKEKGFSIAGLV